MIGKRIKELRKKARKSQIELAKELNISSGKLSRLESGTLQGGFADFENIITILTKTPEDKYYLATGERLKSIKPQDELELKLHEAQKEIDWLKGIVQNLSKKGQREGGEHLKPKRNKTPHFARP